MLKDFTIFQIHTPNKVASIYFGGCFFKYKGHYPDGDDKIIKNYLLNAYTNDKVYTNKIILPDMIRAAKQYSMKLIIGMNEVMKEDIPLVSPEIFGKAAGILTDILIENGFNNETAGLNLINEPHERWKLNWQKYVEYVKAADKYVKGRIPMIIYNEEVHFFPSSTGFGYKEILEALKDIPELIFGVHHLSSLGDPPKWKNVEDAKTIADKYKRPLICNEGGSWFKSYREKEGHEINIKLIKKCKELGYLGVGPCLIELNQNGHKIWPPLGYRIWDNNYTKIIDSSNWTSFQEEIKKYWEGSEPPMPERLIYYKIPMMIGDDVKIIEQKLRQLGFDIPIDGKFDLNDSTSVRVFQELTHIVKDGIVGNQTRETLKNITIENFYPEVFQDIFIKKDYPIDLIDYFLLEKAHPNVHGCGKWFKQAEQETGYPVEHQLANAMQESGDKNSAGIFLLGQSYYGRNYKNIYGWAIYDSGPQPSGKFATYKDCILTVPKEIKRLYLDPGAPHNNGTNIFGIEVDYSTAGHNPIRKAQFYRQICAFLDMGIRHRIPEYIEELFPELDKRYQIKQ